MQALLPGTIQIPNSPGFGAWKRPNGHHLSGSTLVEALEYAYQAIQAANPELPDAVIITGSGAQAYGLVWGHFGRDRWTDAIINGKRPELFIGGEALAMGAKHTMTVLLHESAHALNFVHGVADTSRGGRYHNKLFLSRAESLGLAYPVNLGPSTIGYSSVTLTRQGERRWAKAIAKLDIAITLSIQSGWLTLFGPGGGLGGGMGGHGVSRRRNRGTGGSNYVRALCECPDPRIIRVSRSTLASGAITCEICGSKFEER